MLVDSSRKVPSSQEVQLAQVLVELSKNGGDSGVVQSVLLSHTLVVTLYHSVVSLHVVFVRHLFVVSSNHWVSGLHEFLSSLHYPLAGFNHFVVS